jgi:hypothetical protein
MGRVGPFRTVPVAAMPTFLHKLRARADVATAIGGVIALAIVLLASNAPGPARGETLTRNTIRLSLAWYAIALVLMMHLGRDDWRCATVLGRVARWCWTWAIATFLVHLAMAFHFYHGWSHAHAFEHTRQTSGVGEGLYVSYLFTLLWIADALWWHVRPEAYATRPARLGVGLHAFMLFIVFNGMIVFESGAIRWAGVAMFIALALAWKLATRPQESPAA